MRTNTLTYVAPFTMQDMPADNDGVTVACQVAFYRGHRVNVHTEIAEQIASYWQGSGYDGTELTAFANGHLSAPDDLLTEIAQCRKIAAPEDRPELAALRAYVRACTLTQWTIHIAHNGVDISGPWHAYSADDAVETVVTATEVAAGLLGDCECAVDRDDMCDPCSATAVVASLRADGDISTGVSVWSYVINLDSGPFTIRMTSRTATVATLLR